MQRAFDSTQIGGILRGLMRRAYHVIEDVHPPRAAARHRGARAASRGAVELRHTAARRCSPRWTAPRCCALARETGAFVEVVPMIGQYIAPGAVVLRLHRRRAGARSAVGARRVLVLARQRTMDQDPAFALRMFVDIAIRAPVPAVNDPTTAVQALDRIETLLVELHGRAGPWPRARRATGRRAGRFPAPELGRVRQPGADRDAPLRRALGAGRRRLRALHEHLLELVDEAERGPDRARAAAARRALAAHFPDPRRARDPEPPGPARPGQRALARPRRLRIASASSPMDTEPLSLPTGTLTFCFRTSRARAGFGNGSPTRWRAP